MITSRESRKPTQSGSFNAIGKMAQPANGRVELTNTEQVFPVLIFVNKLAGGCLFETKSSKLWPIIYRILVITVAKCLRAAYFTPISRFHDSSIPKSLKANMNIFFLLYAASSTILTIVSVCNGSYHHNTIMIVLKKRFDARYLKCLVSATVSEANFVDKDRPNESQVDRAAPTSEESFRRSIGDKSAALLKRRPLEDGPQLSGRISEVNLVRLFIVSMIVVVAILSFVREEYGDNYLARSHLISLNVTGLKLAPVSHKFGSNGTLTLAARRHVDYLRLYFGGQIGELVIRVTKDFPLIALVHLSLSALDFFQNYGHISLSLMTTAVMTEMLKRANEQDKWRSWQSQPHSVVVTLGQSGGDSNADERKGHEQVVGSKARNRNTQKKPRWQAASAQTKARSGAEGPRDGPRARQTLAIQTSELLLQVYDVLTALRPALSLDFLSVTTYELCRLISTFGFIVAFSTIGQRIWLTLSVLEYFRGALNSVLIRSGYHRLHSEARKIKIAQHQRLVDDWMNLSEGHKDVAPDTSEPVDGHQAAATRLTRKSRIETITNYRLAKAIEQLWPTDWFVPDIKSCLAQNLAVITLVATLQQLVEIRWQLK